MASYLVESYDYLVDHDAGRSEGVVGVGGGSEKIYLHVISVADSAIAKLGPRIDEHGNKEHERLALERNEEWWIAVEGEKAWPRTHRPKLVSRCKLSEHGAPVAVPLTEAELASLRKLGAKV